MLIRNLYLGKVSLYIFISVLFSLMPNVSIAQDEGNSVTPYCIDPNWMPYEGMEDGKHIGISSDYLALIEQYSDLKFQLVETSSWEQTIEYLKDGKCYLVPMLNHSPNRQEYLTFSDVYYRSPNVLVSLKDQPFIQDLLHIKNERIGVIKNYRITEYIERYFPNLKKVYVESEDDGLKQVANKKIDVFVGSMMSLSAKTQQYGYGNLKIAGWAGPEDKLRVGVIKTKEELLPKINNALAQVTEAQRIEIMKRWNHIKLIKNDNGELYLQLFIIALFVTLLLVIRQSQLNKFNRVLNEKNKELELVTSVLEKANQDLEYISFHDSLTDLYNRSYFSQHIKDKIHVIKRSKSPACLMLVDIDHFKKTNDVLGHNVGDQVLKELSVVFNHVVRQSDITARWGGDEFIILLPETSIEAAEKLSTRMLETVRDYPFENAGKVTISIGVSEFNEELDFDQWFDKADQALYRAKSAGRDQASS